MNLLPSGLYRRPWNCTRSCSLIDQELAGYTAGPIYDAKLHAVFVGFVFSMVFGHAPIIFPAVLGLPLTYRPVFYAPLVLLHVSLALRLFSGLMGFSWGRLLGGLLNALAILAFAGLVLSSARKKQA